MSSGGYIPPAGGSGDVVGPASATDDAIATFDGATGKLLQNTSMTCAGNTLALATGPSGFLQRSGLNNGNGDAFTIRAEANMSGTGRIMVWESNNGSLERASLSGTGTLTLAGGLAPNTFVTMGAGAAQPRVAGPLELDYTPVPNTGAAPEVLQSWPLPANALNANGRGIRVTAHGAFATNANAKDVRLNFGGGLLTLNAIAGTGAFWHYEAFIYRTGSNAQTAIINAWVLEAGATTPRFIHGIVNATENDAANITISTEATTATAAADITSVFLLVEALP